ncbi:MAG: purine-nucleoside phosphorylase [Bacteroidales bacterium]|nr:purine-nucleoside phosphorylase [Bacteroidales bacterium]
MATPHIEAKLGEIAETVIMAGDPLRAKFMADTYLQDVKQFNAVRNMYGFTGTYKGKRVSIMGHGMGIPSMAIYVCELYKFYGVQTIIRTGTAGAMQAGIKIGDIVIAEGACTDSHYLDSMGLPGAFAPIASYDLMIKAVSKCEALGYKHYVGNVFSSDVFYDESASWKTWQKMGVLAKEMETSALYGIAAREGKRALTILTISDSMVDNVETTAEERQTGFTHMMDVALGIVSEL